ncbi:MAG: AraC family transcriptional regulator, partial [Lachnospiraceae bacterium]|nr:AraC family transcriptional regulator [Lachnospiraceae bacterium]
MNNKNETLRETRLRGNPAFPFELYEMRTASSPIYVDYHWQDEMELLRIVSGGVELLLDGAEYILCPGELAFINPGQLHRLRGLTPDTAYYAYVFPLKALLFEQEDLSQLKLLRPLLKGAVGFPAVLLNRPALSQALLKTVDSVIALNRSRPLGYELLTKARLLEIICLLGEQGCFAEYHSAGPAGVCKEILLYIQNNYSEKFSVHDISRAVGLSENYFSCFFSRHFKCSFANYLIEYRINRSCVLLETTDLPITEIALECGFSTSSYYIRKFRELKKMTPCRFRRKHEMCAGALDRI